MSLKVSPQEIQQAQQTVFEFLKTKDAEGYVSSLQNLRNALLELNKREENTGPLFGAIIHQAVENGHLDAKVSKVFFECTTQDQAAFAREISQRIIALQLD